MLLSLVVTLMPSFLFSGFLFPITTMPYALQLYTYVFPVRYFNDISLHFGDGNYSIAFRNDFWVDMAGSGDGFCGQCPRCSVGLGPFAQHEWYSAESLKFMGNYSGELELKIENRG